MKKPTFATVLYFLFAISLISGCAQYGQQAPSQAAPQQEAANPNAVEMANFAFSPQEMTISKGTTVTWTNKDSVPHTIISDSGNELASGSLSNGQAYSHTFNQAGTFEYHCGIHIAMKGKIIVK